MKFGTFSIVVGSKACNAECPFCVSKMTIKPHSPFDKSQKWMDENIFFERLDIASEVALRSGCTTVLITGVGEPTLFPFEILSILERIRGKFPIIELQTNGIELGNSPLEGWRRSGLTTVSLSCVCYRQDRNRPIYGTKFISVDRNIELLKRYKFSVRLSCVGINDCVDTPSEIVDLLEHSKHYEVDQTTWRPVYGSSVHAISAEKIQKIIEWTEQGDCRHLLTLPHGAKVYDYKGVNFCLSNCMTRTDNPNEIRQLILFPNGRIGYDWDRPGAVIL